MIKIRNIYIKNEQNNRRLKDSIKNRNDLNDSIAKIINKKKKDSIKRNIKAYAADSLLTAITKKGAHLKSNPTIFSDIEVTFKESEEVIVLDFGDGYFKVCYNSNCGYISDVFFMTNALIWDDIENELVRELKKIKVGEELIKKYGEDIAYRLKNRRYWIGMTKEMAHISLGSPDDINKSVGSWGVHEQWIYESGKLYLYFEGGKLSSYQK